MHPQLEHPPMVAEAQSVKEWLYMRFRSLLFPLVIGVLAVSCTALPRTAAHPATPYVQALSEANSLYSATLTAAGQAHARGILSDAQIEQVRVAGQAVEAALRASKVVLGVWISTGAQSDKAALVLQLGEVERLLANLIALKEGA
jgi:hypothetical protein